MKKNSALFCVLLLTIILLYGCSARVGLENDIVNTTNETNVNSIYHFNEDGYLTNFYASLDLLVERDKNYIVYSNELGRDEHYSVFDNKGNLLDDGYSPYGVKFIKNGNYLEMQYYTNASELNKICYYDLELGKVSRYFTNSLGSSNGLVAYFSKSVDDDIVLVVQDAFDESEYYKEIKRDFSERVFKEMYPVRFLNNNLMIEFSYWSLFNNKITTEIVNLDNIQP